MNYITDLKRLIQRRKIVPNHPEQSPIFKRIADGTMPPPEANIKVTSGEMNQIKEWILQGAKNDANPSKIEITESMINSWISEEP